MKLHFRYNDHICGPFEHEQILLWREKGELTGELWVKPEDSSDWIEIDSIENLPTKTEQSGNSPYVSLLSPSNEPTRVLDFPDLVQRVKTRRKSISVNPKYQKSTVRLGVQHLHKLEQ